MTDIKKLLYGLTDIMSVTGFEGRGSKELYSLIGHCFDSYERDTAGNHIFIKKAAKSTGRKILIDAHFDEIGMIVSGIHDGGFLSVAFVGGIDRGILPAAEVLIYGKETIYGVICSTPPHLQKPGDSKKLPSVEEIRIDTGYSKEALEKIVRIGTPVGFYEKGAELIGGRICGRGFDDKSCGAAVIAGIAMCDSSELKADVYFTFSAREEIAGEGPMLAAFKIKPDIALTADVGFARTPGIKDGGSLEYGKGFGISLTATCNRRLARSLMDIAKENDIPFSVVAEPDDYGTNAAMLQLAMDGIPCVALSLPLGNMHTYNEALDINDAENLARFISKAICDERIFEKNKEGK